MSYRIKATVVAALILLISFGCGGGGGDSGSASTPPPPPPPPAQPTFSLGTSTLHFQAAKPNGGAPASQVVTASVTGSVSFVYLIIRVTGPAVANVTSITLSSTNSGQGTVVPADPAQLGYGSFSSTITVVACTTDPNCSGAQLAGSPATLNVTYTVGSSVETDTVMPRVVAAGRTGAVILRGQGFTPATSVTFGSQSATSLTVVNDSEIHASYPSLPAGTYPISLNAGALSYHASLVSVAPPAFPAASLTYPAAPLAVQGLVFDAERSALFVAVHGASGDSVLRYAFSGGAWQSPSTATVGTLGGISLSHDGSELLVAAASGLTELSPQDLSVTLTTPLPQEVDRNQPYGIALANDGNAVITRDLGGFSRPLLYSESAKTLIVEGAQTSGSLAYNAFAGASGDGSSVLIAQAGGLSSVQPLLKYNAALGTLTPTSLNYQTTANVYAPQTIAAFAPAMDTNGSHIILIGSAQLATAFATQVYGSNLQLLGTLPATTIAAAVSPDGTRAYALDDSGNLSAFDLTASPAGQGAYPQVGAAVMLGTFGETDSFGEAPYGRVKMAISPDGGTLFLAGSGGVGVQPAPH